MRRGCVVALLLFAAIAARAADCHCPRTSSENVCVASNAHYLVCGTVLSRSGGAMRLNGAELFARDGDKALWSIDGTEEALLLYVTPETMRVVLLSQYPAGPHWKWKEVAVAEWRFTAKNAHPKPIARFPGIGATKGEIDAELARYRRFLAHRHDGDFIDLEEHVGRLAAAAIAGDRDAARAFATMHKDAHLDGADGETWEYYRAYLDYVQAGP